MIWYKSDRDIPQEQLVAISLEITADSGEVILKSMDLSRSQNHFEVIPETTEGLMWNHLCQNSRVENYENLSNTYEGRS